MAAKRSCHASPTEPPSRFLDREVADGRHAFTSNVVRASLWFVKQEKGTLASRDEAIARE